MAALLPIEAAGPCLAFRADDFLRIFVNDASPGVFEDNPSGTKTSPGFFKPVQANSGAGMERWFSGTASEKKVQDFFLLDGLKTGTRIQAGFPWAGSTRCWNGKFR